MKQLDRLPVHELSTVNDHSLRFECSATSADRVYGCTEIFSGVGEDSGTTATGNGLADSEGDRRFTGNFGADRVTLGKSDPIYGLVNCSE